MRAIASSTKFTFSDDLKHLDAKINLLAKHQINFSKKLENDQKNFKNIKIGLKKLQKEIEKPKLHYSKKKKLIKEIKEEEEKLRLLKTEIQNLDRMHDILENLNIENKEKLSQIQRDIERNTVNDDE